MDGIREQFSFGIDLGIGSCGWAVIERMGEGGIVDMGSWCFDVPETDKERKPTNQVRRGNRLLRRILRRRRQRMNAIRKLFAQHGLIQTSDRDGLKFPGLDPWALRTRALDELISGEELAVALGAIAKRRGFKSVAKREKSNNASDEGKMLSALSSTKELLARYRTVGEMFVCDERFHKRRRNREGCYDRTVAREDLEYEAKKIFEAQMRLGNPLVSEDLRDTYQEIAFFQRPLQDSENLLGFCRFEKEEKRASKFSPTFEKFRLLTRLANLHVRENGNERALTVNELRRALENLGKTAKISAKEIRKKMGLGENIVFTTIASDKEDADIAVRTGAAMQGTSILRKALGDDLWFRIGDEQRDIIAHCLTFFETNSKIMERLEALGFGEEVRDVVGKALEAGKFAKFKGGADLSNKAMRKLIPHLEQGLRYDEACQREGYDHSASRFDNRDQVISKQQFNQLARDVTAAINNPTAKKALLEGLKQIRTLILHYGLPGSICIELARDVGHSIDKRREIESGIDKATKEREQERKEVRELLGLNDVDGTTLLRYRLWKEQGGRCLYSDRAIALPMLKSADELQIDHILPWSRFGDDSFHNKTLCYAAENQKKRNQTPYEWMEGDKESERWQRFTRQVETLSLKNMKKRNSYLLRNIEKQKEREEGFRSRNLNDTSYAAKVLAEAVHFFYPVGERGGKGERRRIFTRSGKLTAILRRAWGIESLKKGKDGKRLADDRHHALDAVVVAAVGEGEINRLSRDYQQWEEKGLARPLREVAPPWPGFRNEVVAILDRMDGRVRVVARSERRRARGEGHEATIRQVRERDGEQVVFERKVVTALTDSDLKKIKDPERNQHIIKALEDWLARERPKDDLPRTLTGIEIAKVTLESSAKPAVAVRGGTAARGDIVRVDVFSKVNKKGKDQWYLVPIYRHQVMDSQKWPMPPDRATVGGMDENLWPIMDDSYRFRLSLYPRSYVEVIKGNGDILSGYFAGVDRSTGSISLLEHNSTKNKIRSIGAKTLLRLTKYNVDRLGRLYEVKSEPRLWHGEICTYPTLPG